MKKTILLSLVMFAVMTATTVAQIPTTFYMQGYLEDASGNPYNGNISSVEFGIFTSLTGGSAFYSGPVPGGLDCEQGYFELKVEIPSPQAIAGCKDALWWAVSIGGVWQDRLPFYAVPYSVGSKYAEEAERAKPIGPAGGPFLKGHYPDPEINTDALANVIKGMNLYATPTGDARGREIQGKYPDDLVIANRAVQSYHLALNAVRTENIDTGAVSLNRLAKPTDQSRNNLIWWDASNPNNFKWVYATLGQVLGGPLSTGYVPVWDATNDKFINSTITDIAGVVTVNSEFRVNDNTYLLGGLLVDGNTTLNALTAGPTTLSSMIVNGTGYINGNFGVSGLTTLNELEAQATTLSSLAVTNNAYVGGILTVNGLAVLNGGLTTPTITVNSLTVNGTSLLNGDLTVTGTTNLDVLNAGATTLTGPFAVNGNSNLNGNLNVTGTTNLDVLNASTTTIAGPFTVNANSVLNGNLDVTGTTNLNHLTVGGSTTLNSLTINNNLNVNGLTTLNQLEAGATTLNSASITNNLIVDGKTTLNDDLDVVANTHMHGDLTVDGTLNLTDLHLSGYLTVDLDAHINRDLFVNNGANAGYRDGDPAYFYMPFTPPGAPGVGLKDWSFTTKAYVDKFTINLDDNRIPKWDAADSMFVNSLMIEDPVNQLITVEGDLDVTGVATFIDSVYVLVKLDIFGDLLVGGIAEYGGTTAADFYMPVGATDSSFATKNYVDKFTVVLDDNFIPKWDLVNERFVKSIMSENTPGEVFVGGDISVYADAYIGNDLAVVNDASIGNDLAVVNDASIGGDLSVDGIAYYNGVVAPDYMPAGATDASFATKGYVDNSTPTYTLDNYVVPTWDPAPNSTFINSNIYSTTSIPWPVNSLLISAGYPAYTTLFPTNVATYIIGANVLLLTPEVYIPGQLYLGDKKAGGGALSIVLDAARSTGIHITDNEINMPADAVGFYVDLSENGSTGGRAGVFITENDDPDEATLTLGNFGADGSIALAVPVGGVSFEGSMIYGSTIDIEGVEGQILYVVNITGGDFTVTGGAGVTVLGTPAQREVKDETAKQFICVNILGTLNWMPVQ